MNQFAGLCSSLCALNFIQQCMKLTVQVHSGIVRFSLTLYLFFVIVTLFACADPEWVEFTSYSLPLVYVTCMVRSAFTRLTNSSCDWASIKIDVKFVCALEIKNGFKHPHVGLWLPPSHLQRSVPRAGNVSLYFCSIFLGTFLILWRNSRIFLVGTFSMSTTNRYISIRKYLTN